jgi:hypothetical protein
LCRWCWKKKYTPKQVVCKRCGQLKTHQAKGMCKNCYESERKKDRFFICPNCKLKKKYHGRTFCNKCYFLDYQRVVIVCIDCKEERYHHAKGLCDTCYEKKFKRKFISCIFCGKIIEGHTKELCKLCYAKVLRNTPAQKNKNRTRYKTCDIFPFSKSDVCSFCNSKIKLNRHHLDYNDPYKIIILCHKCHSKLHRKAVKI